MAKPSVSIPDELLEEFDGHIDELRLEGEIDLDTSRSEVIQELIRQWLEGNLTLTSETSSDATDDAPLLTAD